MQAFSHATVNTFLIASPDTCSTCQFSCLCSNSIPTLEDGNVAQRGKQCENHGLSQNISPFACHNFIFPIMMRIRSFKLPRARNAIERWPSDHKKHISILGSMWPCVPISHTISPKRRATWQYSIKYKLSIKNCIVAICPMFVFTEIGAVSKTSTPGSFKFTNSAKEFYVLTYNPKQDYSISRRIQIYSLLPKLLLLNLGIFWYFFTRNRTLVWTHLGTILKGNRSLYHKMPLLSTPKLLEWVFICIYSGQLCCILFP